MTKENKEKKRTGRMALLGKPRWKLRKQIACSFLALISKLSGALSLRCFGKFRDDCRRCRG